MKKRNAAFAVYSDVGNRSINEDAFGYCRLEERGCFILCDGLGGHGMGDVASRFAVEVMRARFLDSANNEECIQTAFLAAEDIILAEQKQRNAFRKMKTTAVLATFDNKYVRISHIGDSRAYIFNKNKVVVRTRDHSIPQMLFEAGSIKESEIRNHPDRSVILRVLGVEWEKPENEVLKPIPIGKCQAILLCSDGFWELIDEAEMCDSLEKAITVNDWLESMRNTVKKNGKGRVMDNNTAIAVWFE
ncbi:MAG: serine/threonine-protein phosphatase [Clostridia bacterium]|nr:serine/threonine-protein phosphatase [Clostridia bacterium]